MVSDADGSRHMLPGRFSDRSRKYGEILLVLQCSTSTRPQRPDVSGSLLPFAADAEPDVAERPLPISPGCVPLNHCRRLRRQVRAHRGLWRLEVALFADGDRVAGDHAGCPDAHSQACGAVSNGRDAHDALAPRMASSASTSSPSTRAAFLFGCVNEWFVCSIFLCKRPTLP